MSLVRNLSLRRRAPFFKRPFYRPAAEGSTTELLVAVRPITGLGRAAIRRVRRFAIVARFVARKAVRANMAEIPYLRAQHAIYRATAPRDVTAPIPDTEINDTGTFVVVAGTAPRHPSETIFDAPTDNAITQRTAADRLRRAAHLVCGVRGCGLGLSGDAQPP